MKRIIFAILAALSVSPPAFALNKPQDQAENIATDVSAFDFGLTSSNTTIQSALDILAKTAWYRKYDGWDGSLGAPATAISITGLDGDTETRYQLYARVTNVSGGAATFAVTLNGDSGNNYATQRETWIAGTPSAAQTLNQVYLCATGAAAGNNNSVTFLVDVFQTQTTNKTRGTCKVFWNTGTNFYTYFYQWEHTVSKVTSIQITSSAANGIGAGSGWHLLSLR